MSNLLEQASLVMIPSGYKEDVVYSEIPLNGAGDLTFTRASNGTRINSAGLVEVVPWNLASYSEQIDNAIWNKSNCTITANDTTAPNGTTTADKVVASSNNYTYLTQTIPVNAETYTWSVCLKYSNYAYLMVHLSDGLTFNYGAAYNIQTKTFITKDSQISATTLTDLGDGWMRISITYTYLNATAIANMGILFTNSSGVFAPIASGTAVYLWGAQLNIGSTAKPYFPTTDRLNVPRLTYQNGGGGCPSLLLEKQSTNLVSYSQDFTNSYWSKLGQGVGDTAVVTANYAISPDGTQNATRFVCNLNGGTTSSDRSWMIASFTAQATSTISIWIKLNSAGTKTVLLSDSGGGTKTISGTDWQRIDATFVGAGGEFRIGLIGGSTSDTLDCCIWGAQAESGSYPTSYIPTTSSSATRVADECKKSGIGALIGGTSGTVFFDIKTNPTLSSSNYKQFCYYVTSGGSQSYLYLDGANKITTNATWGSLFYNTALQPNTRYKVALVFAPNDFALYINGVSVATASSGTPNNNVDLQIGQFNGTEMCEFVFNQYTHFPTRLTNSELASLTTI